MEIGRSTSRKINDVTNCSWRLLLLQLLLISTTSVAEEVATCLWKNDPPANIKVGDIVFRKGAGPWTKYFINCSSREKRFSHVGIVVSNGTQCVIIHSEANERTGVGSVRLELWQGFYAGASECAVFRYIGSENAAKRFAARGMALVGVPFDSAFDMEDTNRLYCTEFVRIAINETLNTNLVGWTSVCNKRVVAIDDIYRNDFKKIFDSQESDCDAHNVRKSGASIKAMGVDRPERGKLNRLGTPANP